MSNYFGVRSRAGAVALACALGFGVAACGGSDAPVRSKDNFCATYVEEKKKFVGQYGGIGQEGGSPSGGQILTDLILGLQSLGDVGVILDKLDKVAPNDIEPDVAAVKESWKGMQGTLGDEASNALNPTGLIGAVLKGLLASVESNGSWERVGNYVSTNCPNA